MKPLLVLALDAEVLRYCADEEIQVVACYGPSGKDWGDPLPPAGAVFVEDASDVRQVLAALARAGYTDTDFIGIQTSDERSVVTAAVLCRLFDLPGQVPRTAVNFRDKWLQKQAIRAAGVPTADSILIEDIRDATVTMAPFTQAVVKPVSGAGTSLTAHLSSDEDLRRFALSLNGPQRTFVLEEFIDGDEWIADGIVYQERLIFFSVSRYAEPCLTAVTQNIPVQIESMHPDAECYDLARPIVEASLKGLQFTDGVFHMELFRHDGTFMFGECAARRGGGHLQQLVSCRFGVDLAGAAVRIAMGEPPLVRARVRPGAVGSVYLPNHVGTLADFPSARQIAELPGVEYAQIEVPRGFRMSSGTPDTVSKIGQVIVTADSSAALADRLRDVGGWFEERLVVIPEGTPRELRAWSEGMRSVAS